MRLLHVFACLLVLLGIAGCVSAPEGVPPSFVDPAKYPLSSMLRVHCVQLFHNMSDPGR